MSRGRQPSWLGRDPDRIPLTSPIMGSQTFMPPIRKWPSPYLKALFRSVLTANILFILFFFIVPHDLQYVTKGLTAYGGVVLLWCSVLSFGADWRYATLGLLVSLFSFFLGSLPTLAY
jgi:hypothetical protein